MNPPTAVRIYRALAAAPPRYVTELRRDVRYGLRALAASPGFTAVAVISLSLGIGVATCAYSEVNGLLRELPGVPNPGELLGLQAPISYPTYKRFRELRDLFSGTFAYVAPVPFGLSQRGSAERTWGHLVTPSYFSTLGVRPRLGRFFDESDEDSGQVTAVVVSYRFWERRLGADPSAIATKLRINGQPCTIVGVGPKEFLGASPALFPADLWLPITADARLAPELGNDALDRRDVTMFQMGARLRPGVSDAAAQAQLNAVAQQLAEFHGDPDREQKGQRVSLVGGGRILPLRKQDVPFFKDFLLMLGGLLLLIACANIANMMLGRATDRRREITVRLALGASRARLVRQLLTESVLLAAAAGPPAFLFSVWMMHLMSSLRMPLPIPVVLDLRPDWRALVFTFGVTTLTGIAFGLVPALRATRTDIVSALKEGYVSHSGRHRLFSLRNAMVLSQMAASLTLLLMTGYLGLGIQNTLGVQEGIDPTDLYLISLDPVRDGYSAPRAQEFFETLLNCLKRLPGVTAVCLTDTVPVAVDGNAGVQLSTGAEASGQARDTHWARKHIVGREYFETAGIRMVSGRGFRREDETSGSSAIVVSQEAVRRFWNGRDPVGRAIDLRNSGASAGFGAMPGTIDFRDIVLGKESRTFHVVGVASDVSEDLVASKKHPAIYFPLRPADYAQPSLRGITIMVRARPGVDILSQVRREISALDSAIVPFNASSMNEHISQFMSTLRAASWTYGMLGFFGLILASVGVAGVTAHSVAKRGHEIGIRMALGAQKRNVLALVMKEGATLVTAGALVGTAFALAGIRALSGIFFSIASIQAYDPVLLVGAPLLLVALALLACYLPARRSMRIDPAVTLRME